MTINDEFFKKTQENLKRIKAQNNQKTMKSYNIETKSASLEAEENNEDTHDEQDAPVISLADFRRKKLTTVQNKVVPAEESRYSQETTEDRLQRIKDSIQRINNLMSELNSVNNTGTKK